MSKLIGHLTSWVSENPGLAMMLGSVASGLAANAVLRAVKSESAIPPSRADEAFREYVVCTDVHDL